MSLAVDPVQIVQCMEPRTKINNKRSYAVLKGAQQVSWKPNISTSFSDTSIQWSAPPPNPGIIIDRKVMMNVPIELTFTGADQGTLLLTLTGGIDAPRAYPISQIIQNAAVTINNTQVSLNTSDVLQTLLRYHNPESWREMECSMSPTQLDQSQAYSDLTGGVRNPLNNYASSVSGADNGRGAFPITVMSHTNTSAVIRFEPTEYLYIPPFESGGCDNSGFIGVQTMDFNISIGNLSRAWSHNSSGNTITTVSGRIYSAPRLFFNYITPDMTAVIPRSVVYPYFEIQRYPTNWGNILAGESAVIPSANIQLNSIPRRMYIMARRRNADQTYLTTDTFGQITNLSVNWNNNSGLLSSAQPQDLFKMCNKNQCNLSWDQFSKFVGSPVCIEFGSDIGLLPDETGGMLGTYQLQLQATVKNLSAATINFDLYIITVSEGTFTITDNRSVAQIGIVSKMDVVNSDKAPMVDYNELQKVHGGNFWDSVKGFFGDVGRGIKKGYDYVAPIVKEVLPYVKDAKALLGMGGARRKGGVPSGGKRKKRGGVLLGAGLRGGAMVDRDDLFENIEEAEEKSDSESESE